MPSLSWTHATLPDDATGLRIDRASGNCQILRSGARSLTRLCLADAPQPERTAVSLGAAGLTLRQDWLSSSPLYLYGDEREIIVSHAVADIHALKPLLPDTASLVDFYRHGTLKGENVYFRGLSHIPVGDSLILGGEPLQAYRREACRPDLGAPLVDADIETALADDMERRLAGRRYCFALSGGIDSTTLVAIWRHRHPEDELVCYHAVTGGGEDTPYARLAAQQMGVRLREVVVGHDATAREAFEAAVSLESGPIALTGNAVAFGAVCRQARADGFDCIVDGTAADVLFASFYDIDGAAWLRSTDAVALADSIQAFHRRAPEIRRGTDLEDFSAHIYRRIKESMYRKWVSQHQANSLAHGIDIIMPFATHALLAYAENPPSVFFRDGYSKSALREILARRCSDELAYRISKQGARWPTRGYLTTHRAHIARLIAESALCRALFPAYLLRAARLGWLSKGRLARLYAIALYGRHLTGGPGDASAS